MQTLEQSVAAAPIEPPARPSLLRRFIAKLREQTRFSLATLIEWMAAYTLAFAAAWCRADPVFVSGILVGVLLSVLCARLFLRSEGRRVLHSFVFALVIAAGAVMGALVLRDARVRVAERLILADEVTISRLKEQLDGQDLQDQKSAAEAEQSFIEDTVQTLFHIATPGTARTKLNDVREWVDAEWHSHRSNAQPFANGPAYDCALTLVADQHARYSVQRALLDPATNVARKVQLRELERVKSRRQQIRDEAVSLDLRLAPLPATLEDWSPLLVPAARRLKLHVTCDLIDCTPADVKRAVLQLSGLHLEFAPRVNAEQLGELSLRVTDMNAELWLQWVAKLWDLEPRHEPGSDTVVFDKPEK